jgi:hypothetical protein
MRKPAIILLTLLLTFGVLAVPLFGAGEAQGAALPLAGKLNVDGAGVPETFLNDNGQIYVPIRPVAVQTGIALGWDDSAGALLFTYPDQSTQRGYVKSDRLVEQEYSSLADFLVSGGRTYINLNNLRSIVKRQVFWDQADNTLYLYRCANQAQGSSILQSLPYEGLDVVDNAVSFNLEGLPQASWQMEGELQDLRLVGTTTRGQVTEIQVAAFYTQTDGNLAQLLITQRKLPGGHRIVFTRAHSPRGQQVLQVITDQSSQVYGSKAYHYLDKGVLKEYQYEEPFINHQRLTINSGTSVDQWHLLSPVDLTLDNPISQRAWKASLEYHSSNDWVTPEGAYRSTPVEYSSNAQLRNKNVNLQASVPMLLMDSLNTHSHPLLEALVHNARFTLFEMLGEDNYWRSGVNVTYLNRSYNLGPNYIDTRMSVDASLFLLRYGFYFGDEEAVRQGAWFKNFFVSRKSQNQVYALGGGFMYPDYYSESQKSKTLVSLNHAVYEMNYLYTIYNELGDPEAKTLADEIRLFINNSKDKWVSPNGDLYYALSPQGNYYAEDYVNITYVDLYVAKGILEYMEVKDAAVEGLLAKKETYLDSIAAPQFESHLEVDEVTEKFDVQSSRKGDFFYPYPLQVQMAEGAKQAHFACGTYHWILGGKSVTYLGRTYDLDPTEKYFITLTKWGLNVTGNKPIPLPEFEGGQEE